MQITMKYKDTQFIDMILFFIAERQSIEQPYIFI